MTSRSSAGQTAVWVAGRVVELVLLAGLLVVLLLAAALSLAGRVHGRARW